MKNGDKYLIAQVCD